MKPEALATIAVRLLGLILILLTLESVALIALALVLAVLGRVMEDPQLMAASPAWLGELITSGDIFLLPLGLYMFLSGKWFIRRIVRGLGPPPEGICPACGYDLKGLRVSRCPECGAKLPKGVIRATEVAGKEHRSQKGPPTAS